MTRRKITEGQPRESAERCANGDCGRPRLVAPGVKLCASCRLAFLTGYQEGFQSPRRAAAVKVAGPPSEAMHVLERFGHPAKPGDGEWYDCMVVAVRALEESADVWRRQSDKMTGQVVILEAEIARILKQRDESMAGATISALEAEIARLRSLAYSHVNNPDPIPWKTLHEEAATRAEKAEAERDKFAITIAEALASEEVAAIAAETGSGILAKTFAKELREVKARLAAAEAAIRWALGEGDDNPLFHQRRPGEGAYWWRTELRRRAALGSKP